MSSTSNTEEREPYYGPGVDPNYKVPEPTRGMLAAGTKKILDHMLAAERRYGDGEAHRRLVFIYTGHRRTEILGDNIYTNVTALHPLLRKDYPLIQVSGGRSAVHLAYRLTDLGRKLAR